VNNEGKDEQDVKYVVVIEWCFVFLHNYICVQATFSNSVNEPISIRLPSGSAT
jgi:hypothetical protein